MTKAYGNQHHANIPHNHGLSRSDIPPPMLASTSTATPAPHRLFWALLILALLVALVPTAFPAMDLAAADLFTGPQPAIASGDWWWVHGINLYVPALFRGALALCFIGWLVVTFSQR